MTVGKAIRRPDGRLLGARLVDGSILLFAALFLGLPLMSVLLAGLRSNLMKLLSEPIFWQSAATSLAVSISAATIALLISMMLVGARRAALLRRSGISGAGAFFAAMGGASSLVLLVPPIVLATGWFLALRSFGDASAVAPLLIVAINALMSLPFVMRVLEPAFIVHKRRTQKLAASLGVSGWMRLRLIDMPALIKPVLTAFSFAMALSLGDLGAVALFGSDSFVTLPWLVYSRMGSYRTNDADGLALILGILCLLLTIAGTLGPARREVAFHG